MIKYNNANINDWDYGTSNIIKVYRNGAICYYKLDASAPSGQTPCYAVVNNISSYTDREFEDVFNKADKKWYKLNNLNTYEEYGVYGSGRNITYYDGKLTIDDGYEYEYTGGSWVNVGEVSGSTATLPDVPFVLNYNAKNYDATTHSIPMIIGQLNDTDAVAYNNPNNIVDHHEDGYITISSSSMRIRKQGQDISLFNRQSNSTDSDLTIVTKAKTTSSGVGNIITNRDWNYNWMYRQYSDNLTFHGNMQTGNISCSSSNPDILSVRTYYDNGTKVKYNNWTQNTSTTPIDFTYGDTNSDDSNAGALFVGYAWNDGNEQWQGDFYWVYMSQNTLTDVQVQQVIAYNEGGGQSEYPIYYDDKSDPPDNVTFTSMTEAESYECPWVGMHATIDGSGYTFTGDSISGYEWVYIPSKDSNFVIGDFNMFVSSSTEVTEGYYIIYNYNYNSSYANRNYLFSWNSGNTWNGYYTLGNMNHSDSEQSVPISSSEIIDDAVWELKDAGNGYFYIRNVGTNKYWYYLGTSASFGVPLTDNVNQATPVSIQDWRSCLAFVEKQSSYNHPINRLYNYPYRYGWYDTLASDGNNQYYMRKYVP